MTSWRAFTARASTAPQIGYFGQTEDCRRFDGRVAVERFSLADHQKAKAQCLRQCVTVGSVFEIEGETGARPPIFQVLTMSGSGFSAPNTQEVCAALHRMNPASFVNS